MNQKHEKKGREKHYRKARKMDSILTHAQQLVYTLISLMASVYQGENLEAMLGLFLEGTVNADGRSRGWFKTAKHRFRLHRFS